MSTLDKRLIRIKWIIKFKKVEKGVVYYYFFLGMVYVEIRK